ncbi:conserved Plasmodium protein, unknown function [Plasmodium malariae]|uniref:Uncharacterized protein n=2 Tax=Plasmodium (Plasmodium) TaxID=418103 RepID=A0A1D3SPF0_PLAMA|nr:conserved Plasmodium protein, unknown function [Plasmodium malariae]SCO93786.1 conserved Plasmodium protein, unknown function [Plasmodium malariae]
MNEIKKTVLTEKKNEEITTILNKNILFKEYSNTNDLKDDTFVNITTDYSLESEKEKSNISLFSIFKKKLKEEKYCSRFLILFKIPCNANQKKKVIETLKADLKEKYGPITGVCIMVNIYGIMLLECVGTSNIFSFIKHLGGIKEIYKVQILYFSELHNQIINDDFYFYEYSKEDPKGVSSGECNYVDEVWDLYINVLSLCCFIKNNKDKQNIFDLNENIKKNFSSLPNLYNDDAKQYLWNMDEFVSFFIEDFKLPFDDFSDDFLDF